MMRSLTTVGILAALCATASADHFRDRGGGFQYQQQYSQPSLRYAPQNRQPQTEARYQERNKLADVGLAGFGNRAFIQLPQYAGSLDYLELRADRTPVMLRDVVVQFADGSSIHTGSRGIVEPFEGRVIDLPAGCAPVTAVMPEYDTPRDRSARLEIFGVHDHRGGWSSQSSWSSPSSGWTYQPSGWTYR